MILLQSFNIDLPAEPLTFLTSITIGNFDGCHLGHQKLIKDAIEGCHNNQCQSTAMTFTPRPEAYFRHVKEKLLFTDSQKIRSFKELNFKALLIQNFDEKFCHIDHIFFYENVLKDYLNVKVISVGENFCFGKNRLGNSKRLQDLCQKDNIQLKLSHDVQYEEAPISSTRIREDLQNGNIGQVNAMLGRPYLLEGIICKGKQLGRQIGFPTLNLSQCDQLLPAYGVYAGYVWLEPKESGQEPSIMKLSPKVIPAIFNCGLQPTLVSEQKTAQIEAHLLVGNYAENSHYGFHAGFYFTHFIRNEKQFKDIETLKKQINLDIKKVKKYLNI